MKRNATKKMEGQHKGVDEARVEGTEHLRLCRVEKTCAIKDVFCKNRENV